MAITVNGSGTITGVSVGGLPDGIVDTDMIAADAVTSAKIGSKTFTSYAIICDQKAQNTQGGTATNGAHRTRDLNTEIADPDGIVSISSNQFTLQAGSYLIEARAPGYDCHGHQTRLYNATTSTTIQNGTTGYSNAAGNVLSYSVVLARVVITGATAFEIQHRVATTKADTGFGVAFNVAQEIYTTVKIYKEA